MARAPLARLAALLLLVAGASSQAAGPEDGPDEIDRALRAVREASPVVRPQAARRLVSFGADAAERIRERCPSPADLAELGSELVSVLADFEDPALRGLLWRSLADPDFPWRPAAALALAESAAPAEGAHFWALLQDPLAAVRVAGIAALERLDLRGATDDLRGLLADGDGRVRRAAAALLDRWGERWALAWILEELQRTDTFFDETSGLTARFDAARIARERLGDDFGFRPERPPTDPENARALAALADAFRTAAGSVAIALPAPARAGAAREGDLFGLRVRSCRRGEVQLVWNRDGALYVGRGNAARVPLPEGTVERLAEACAAAGAALGEARFFGQPGCDSERFCLRTDDGLRSWLVSKGADPEEDLRPAPLDALAASLLATVPEDGDDPRLEGLRARAAAALESVGGALP